MRAEIRTPEKDLLHFVFEADGFLRHMVRNMVGTMVEVGRGKVGAAAISGILQSRDRRKAGVKAPPQGLFLKMVHY